MHMVDIPVPWRDLLRQDGHDPDTILAAVDRELAGRDTVPARDRLTRALTMCPLDRIAVLLLGQDPYPTPGHACGLAFAVPAGCAPLPGSLRNILDEVEASTGRRPSPDLERWATSGVLLLNRWLSLDERPSMRAAWDALTAAVMAALIRRHTRPLVVMAWGRPAMDLIEKRTAIADPAACVAPRLYLKASHPSPLGFYKASARAPAFRGCRHFAQADEWLVAQGAAPIAWA